MVETPPQPLPPQGGISKIINGPVLKAAQWGVSVSTVHPSLHRFKNAAGLTIGLFAGRQLMNLMTGETPGGEKISIDNVPGPLKELHGCMAYNHFSDDPNDRWMKVVDLWLPAALGALGAIAGSHDYALEQPLVQGVKAILKNPKALTLDKAESAAIVTQAKPWRVLSGITSLFGSSSGFQLVPGPTNYGTTLSNSFLGTVARNKLHTPYMPWVQKFWNANNHPYPFGPTTMLGKIRDQMVHNPAANPAEERQMAYAILEPWFGEHVTQKHVSDFLKELHTARNKFFKEGGVPENLKAECEKELNALVSGLGLEKTLMKIGLNPVEATIGQNGFMETFSRLLGAEKPLNKIERQYKQAFAARNKLTIDPTHLPHAPHEAHPTIDAFGKVVALGAGGAVVASIVGSRDYHESDNIALHKKAAEAAKQAEITGKQADADEAKAAEFCAEHPAACVPRKNSSWADSINGRPLEVMEWATDALNSPETLGMHRLSCAFGMTAGGYVGMKLMEALTGRTLTGAHVGMDKLPGFIKPYYKSMAYNPHSDHPKDRWGYVMHFLVPAVTATAGIMGASNQFFGDRAKKFENANYIDEFEEKATLKQAGAWTGVTALSALFVTPSGFPYLPFPFPNYGTALGTRFTLSSGRKMIMPVLGDMWTGTASRYPYGPSKLRDHMIKYAVNNPTKHPEQLEEMAIGILKPWFENVTEQQVESFIARVEADRDKYLREGGIPEKLKADCEKELLSHFKGAGLEKTLREIGLDPEKAHLANNGLSGRIAEWMGAESTVNATKADFATRYKERAAKEAAAEHSLAG